VGYHYVVLNYHKTIESDTVFPATVSLHWHRAIWFSERTRVYSWNTYPTRLFIVVTSTPCMPVLSCIWVADQNKVTC